MVVAAIHPSANSLRIALRATIGLRGVEAKDKDETAVSEFIQWILAAHSPVWNSMERTFYTLHMRARMQAVQQ
jgi:hypothetical protein